MWGVKTKVMRISRKPSTLQIVIDQKQLKNVEYFNCLVSTMMNDAICTREIKSRIVMEKAAFNRNKETVFTCKLDVSFKKKLVKCYIWNIVV
jgi:hypothetical protein